MIFVAGIPAAHYPSIIKSVVASLPGELITGLPVREYEGYSRQYKNDCLDTIKAFEAGRPQCFDRGLSVICLTQSGDDFGVVRENFYPFSIVTEVKFGRRFATSPAQARRDKNEAERQIIAKAKKQVKLANEVSNYLKSRSNRTPMLLPIRRFERQELADAVREAWVFLQNADSAGQRLEAICSRFEESFPFRRKPGAKSGHFTNTKGIEFKAPGRDLHGSPRPDVAGHPDFCFFNGHLRIGGAIRNGFHYDCTKGGLKYGGTFAACHGQIVQRTGNPHLNIYPNDFIR